MRSVILITGIIFIFSVSAFAGGFNFSLVGNDPHKPDHIETSASFSTIRKTCLVDTGARYTHVKSPILAELPVIGQESGGGISGVQTSTDLISVDLRIGTWGKPGLTIGRTEALPFDCLIGNDLFLTKEFSIDFKELKFSDEVGFHGTTFPLHQYKFDRGGEFGFDIDVAGNTISSIFDTGATNTVIDSAFVDSHSNDFEFLKEINAVEGSDQIIKIKVYMAKKLKFGNLEKKNVEIYAVDLAPLQSKIPGIQAVIGLSEMTAQKWYFNNKLSSWGIY